MKVSYKIVQSIELRQQLAAQHRYIEELQKQLEPSVVQEIRAELSAQEEEK